MKLKTSDCNIVWSLRDPCLGFLNNVFCVLSAVSMSLCNLVSLCFLFFRIFYTRYSEITCLISCLLSNSVWYVHEKLCHFGEENKKRPHSENAQSPQPVFPGRSRCPLGAPGCAVRQPQHQKRFPTSRLQTSSLFYKYLPL